MGGGSWAGGQPALRGPHEARLPAQIRGTTQRAVCEVPLDHPDRRRAYLVPLFLEARVAGDPREGGGAHLGIREGNPLEGRREARSGLTAPAGAVVGTAEGLRRPIS